MKAIIIPKQIVTVDDANRILKNHAVAVSDGRIQKLIPLKELNLKKYDGEIIELKSLTLIPGFIQTHIHLCQTLFRGLADDLELLDWLQQKIFPYENAHNKNSLRASVRLGINELLLGGTTAVLDMGTLRYQEVIFEELMYSGLYAAAGKCMIDINDLFPDFKSTTKAELDSSLDLARSFHNTENGRIKYGFAPRFVLSCSEKLLRDTNAMMKDFPGSIFHTHASENKHEIEEVRKRFGKNNIEYFNSIGILTDRTVLAHGVHVNDPEISFLKKSDTRISHCPSSNLKLGSGIADIPNYLSKGITVSLGADGAPCNNNLSIFNEMKLAALIQKPFYGPSSMNARTVFRMATIDGAKTLHLEKEIGSIEIGKKANFVFIDLDTPNNSLNHEDQSFYSNIVYSASTVNVKHVMIDGKWVVKDSQSLIYDAGEILAQGKDELKKLLNRV